LKKLFKVYKDNRNKLNSILLILFIYNIITIAKLLIFLVVYLRIELTISNLLIINYWNRSTNLKYLVSKI